LLWTLSSTAEGRSVTQEHNTKEKPAFLINQTIKETLATAEPSKQDECNQTMTKVFINGEGVDTENDKILQTTWYFTGICMLAHFSW
jgi:hypothetical protein